MGNMIDNRLIMEATISRMTIINTSEKTTMIEVRIHITLNIQRGIMIEAQWTSIKEETIIEVDVEEVIEETAEMVLNKVILKFQS